MNQSVSGVAGRYATALFELATQNRAVDAVWGQLERFQALLDGSSDLRRVMSAPVFTSAEQGRVIQALAKESGLSGIGLNFFLLLAKNRRLGIAGQAIQGFRALMAQARGEIHADVTSAEPLTAAQLTRVRSVLKEKLGHDVTVTNLSDPSIIGGLIVRVGSRMIDSSLKTKLQSLKTVMKGTA